jgi:hypothetical protein
MYAPSFFMPPPVKKAGSVLLICIYAVLQGLNSPLTSTPTVPPPIRELSAVERKTANTIIPNAFNCFSHQNMQMRLNTHPPPIPILIPPQTTMSEKELKPVRLDLYPGDVKQISLCSTSTAHRRMKQCRDALAKQVHQTLTIREYCDYYGYDYLEVLKQLRLLT